MKPKVTVIFPYRNRDAERVERSLGSLCSQEAVKKMEIIFVDFGSDDVHQEKIKNLLKKFSQVNYVYNHTQGMPWSRSHALNTGIKLASSDFVFTADVDMIFDAEFGSCLLKLTEQDDAVFFSVGYLPKKFRFGKAIQPPLYRKSESFALGLALINRNALLALRGYDEFYCFWGLEDNDIHARLQATGYRCRFFESEVLLYHQWHPAANTSMPDGWRTCMGEYFEAMKSVPVRNQSHEWGKIFTLRERTAWNALNRNITDSTPLACRKVFFEWQLINKLENTASGETVSGIFTDTFSEKYLRAKPGKIAGLLNSLTGFLRLQVNVSTTYSGLFMTAEQAYNSFFYFVHFNRKQISDYAFRIHKNNQLEYAFTKF